MNVTTIVLINDVWMTALSWERWVKHYRDKNYGVVAPDWPGRDGDAKQPRRDPSKYARAGLTEVINHYEQIIRKLEAAPIIIGHGFGGLATQILLDRGWGAAGVAIAPVAPRGVFRSILGNLKFLAKARLTRKQFHHEFSNTLDEAASIGAFKRYIIPASNRILGQVAFANFVPDAPSAVRFHNNSRAPLLFVAGDKDRVVPCSLVKANFDNYRGSKAETDFKEFSNQSHFTLIQETTVADYVLGWALCRSNGSRLDRASSQNDGWSVQL